MKKIMFYINAIHHGGAERVVCNLASEFSQHDYESIIVTSFRDTWEYVPGAMVKRLTLCEHPLKKNVLIKNITLIKKLRKIIKKEKPDVLISFMAEPNFRAVLSSVGFDNKVIVSVRNDPNKEYPNLIYRICARILYHFADGVVFQTEDAKKFFSNSIQNKSQIIMNQVDESFFNIKYDGKRQDVVTTGRLTIQKNHKMLILSFAKIAKKVQDNLVIYGEGELRTELERLIFDLNMQERIFLPGSVSDVGETIKSAKLFVLSSDYEGMPNSLMEAMALGVPCISTDCPCGGPRMLFGKELSNRLISCGDVNELGRRLEELLINNESGEVERALAVKFKPDRVYAEWENYICRIGK